MFFILNLIIFSNFCSKVMQNVMIVCLYIICMHLLRCFPTNESMSSCSSFNIWKSFNYYRMYNKMQTLYQFHSYYESNTIRPCPQLIPLKTFT